MLFQPSAYMNTTHITETVADINSNSVVTSLTLTACERGRAVPAGSGLTAHTKRLRSARWAAETSQMMHSCVSLTSISLSQLVQYGKLGDISVSMGISLTRVTRYARG